MSQHYVHPTPERLETAFEYLEAYNREQVRAAELKAKKKGKARAQTA